MKKIIFILIAAALCCTSCSFLEVPLESSISTSNFYKTTEDFELGLYGAYEALVNRDHNGGNRCGSYFLGFMILGRVGTDEMVSLYDDGRGCMSLTEYTYDASNEYIKGIWLMMYMGLQRVNTVIDRLIPTDIGSEYDKNRILGEAYFLRSFFYFILVRLYGEVPMTEGEVVDVHNMNLERRSIPDVYNRIVTDLKEAERLLPENNGVGHPCSLTASAMLGKVYLQMAGEPLEDPTAAALAKEELEKVIDSGKYALVTDYFSQFDGLHEYNSEYIWDIEFTNQGNTNFGGQVGTIEGISHPDHLHWILCTSCREFYEIYDPRDSRRDNVARYALEYDTDGTTLKKVEYEGDPNGDWYFFAYKFRHPLTEQERGAGWANWSNPINFPITRYADVLLEYAEAELRSTGLTAKGLECVNMVRRRGFGKPIDHSSTICDLSTLTLDDLLEERSRELCFEGQRWYDLVRYGKLIEGVKRLSKYQLTIDCTDQALNIKEKHKFFPIPQDVIDASNGALKQNRGWAE